MRSNTNPSSEIVINVSQVPQRSPLRYAGGKSWLVPVLRTWLASRARPAEFLEPFAGGGVLSLTAVMEDRADRATLVELDADVGAVWAAVLGEDADWLCARIRRFEMTPGRVRRVLDAPAQSTRERAFQTILKNRVRRGGILAAGAGLVRAGEKGKGLASRWYPETLAKRIEAIARFRDRLTFVQGDGLAALRRALDRTDAVCFIDPPYTAGRRLYTHFDLDHAELFRTAARLRGDFLLTYDHAPNIVDLAQHHGFQTRLVPMKNTHHARMTELLIGRDLGWLPDRASQNRNFPASPGVSLPRSKSRSGS